MLSLLAKHSIRRRILLSDKTCLRKHDLNRRGCFPCIRRYTPRLQEDALRRAQSYESERRPIGRRNCDWGLFTFKNSSVINAAIGLIPGQKEPNSVSFSQLFEDSEIGQSRRARVQRIIDSQCIEFSAHGVELGFSYQEGLRVDDGTDAPATDPLGQGYDDLVIDFRIHGSRTKLCLFLRMIS